VLDFTTQTWPGAVQCLAFQGSRLLACSDEVSGFVVGASTDDGASFTPLLRLSCVRGPLACGEGQYGRQVVTNRPSRYAIQPTARLDPA
jgi:hypothetical protein